MLEKKSGRYTLEVPLDASGIEFECANGYHGEVGGYDG